MILIIVNVCVWATNNIIITSLFIVDDIYLTVQLSIFNTVHRPFIKVFTQNIIINTHLTYKNKTKY